MQMKFFSKEYKIGLSAIIAKLIKGKKITEHEESRIINYASLFYRLFLREKIDPGSPFLVKIKNNNMSLTFLTISSCSYYYLLIIKYNGKYKKVLIAENKKQSKIIKDDMSAFLRKSSIRIFYIKDNFLMDKIEEFL